MHCVMHLYANKIYAYDECHAMILVSWIETFIFIRGVIIQMKPMKQCNYFLTNKCHQWNAKITPSQLRMRIKDDIFCFTHLWWCHNGWASNILIVVTPVSTTQNVGCPSIMTPLKMGTTKNVISYSLNKYWSLHMLSVTSDGNCKEIW